MTGKAGVLAPVAPDARRRWEAAQLVVLAIGAELTYLALALVPLLPMVIFTGVFYGPKIASGFAVLFTLGMWWLVQAQVPEPEGVPLPVDTPLARDIEALCRQANAPRIDQVLLDDSLNAAASTSRGFLSLIGVRRTLVLGLPLLRLLQPQEVRAVVAHELGHFSREHGRLGHWVYLVRSKWDHIVHEPSEEGVWAFTQMLAKWFVPYFLRRSSAWSLRCEYEADAVAARIVGAAPLGSALARLEVLSSAQRGQVKDRVRALCRENAEPIDDYWGVVHEVAAQAEWSEHQPIHRSVYDTHPPLRERVRPLGVEPQAPDWVSWQSAGPDLLGAEWATLEAEGRHRWREKQRVSWFLDHIRLRSVARGLETANTPSERAVLEERLSPSPATLEALREQVAEHPADAVLAYELGAALLRREDAAGCVVLRAAARVDARLAPRASAVVARFQRQHGTDEEAGRASRQALHARQALEPVWSGLFRALLTKAEPAAEIDHHALAEAVASSTLVDAAWVVATDVTTPAGMTWRVVLLVLRIDLDTMMDVPTNEDMIAEEWTDVLAALLPANVVPEVRTKLTTEPFNPNLLAQLQSVQGSLLKAPRLPLNEGIMKFDSL